MISTNVFRMSKFYRMVNHGETYEFQLLEFKGHDDYLLRDIYTLETYLFSDLIKFGKGKDYLLEERVEEK